MKNIGLIAGNGQFPIIFSKAAREKGFTVFAAAHLKETDPDLEKYVDGIVWIYLGQIKKIIKFFKDNHISEAVMIGGITKTRIFKDIRPDMKAISLIAGMKDTHDDGLLRGFAGALEKEGIDVKPSTFLLPEILAEEGCWTKRKPTKTEQSDIDIGWRLAKEIGRLDIGQCIVIEGGSVLAVEAIDGTDATIKRGGSLGSGSAVVIKVCKPNQDLRFDIPAIGTETIINMHKAGASTLVVEAGRAVVFNRDEMISTAEEHNISIVALDPEEMKPVSNTG